MRADERGRKRKIGRAEGGRYRAIIIPRGSRKYSSIQEHTKEQGDNTGVLDALIEIYKSKHLRSFRQKRKEDEEQEAQRENRERGIKVTAHFLRPIVHTYVYILFKLCSHFLV
jgi:hypothetical protein